MHTQAHGWKACHSPLIEPEPEPELEPEPERRVASLPLPWLPPPQVDGLPLARVSLPCTAYRVGEVVQGRVRLERQPAAGAPGACEAVAVRRRLELHPLTPLHPLIMLHTLHPL